MFGLNVHHPSTKKYGTRNIPASTHHMSYNVLQSRTSSTQRMGPNKLGAMEQAKENHGAKAQPAKPGQKNIQRVFGTNITNRTTRTPAPKADNEIEHAFYNETEMYVESPLDFLDMKKLREPCEVRKRTPRPLLEEEPFSLVGFEIDMNPALGTFFCRPLSL